MQTLEQTEQFQEVTVSTNLKCQSCLSKLQPSLDQAPEILEWKADLTSAAKTVTAKVSGAQPAEKLVEVVTNAGYEAAIVENSQPGPEILQSEPAAVAEEKSKFSLATYKPLLLVVFYVAGAAAILTSMQTTGATLENFMRYFMGCFFLGFAFFKMLDVSKFADAFATYDIVARRSRLYAVLYPFLEFTLGVAFILGVFPTIVNLVTATVMGVGLIGVLQAVRKRQAIQCACLGTVFNLPMSAVTIIENTAMILMALFMLWP
ncbi:heavy-metal-associated domain-containing protein [Gimesia chilikensis]|uniref:Copper exporting ATPase n=1 Tax=Gimesia chilikensis TaxID=2605989 RepID=A0A517PP69_9PLAN|nr:MauE/DoxX family redox-associated membrane protein [Gimesia chilikensis]QDT21164.1 copper exporting ATPase [Gimesia chilikensis]